ncbi:hypothetical protein Goshw_015426, partial [Gossypium schwendimanii]|nr:hypothetical protein [Gossypium schwendimanii]
MSGGATVSNDKVVVESGGADRSKEYGLWMVVERKQLQNLRLERKKGAGNPGNEIVVGKTGECFDRVVFSVILKLTAAEC